ncbi:desulfoferrodoxin, partial [Candidatus Woesearchaeota archaeon]
YKCEICGNVVSVLEAHGGELVCCGKPMKLIEEKTSQQEGKEKHVPVVTVDGSKVTVKVGSVDHPMEENHFIEMIQLLKEGKVIFCRKLKPGDKPVAEFYVENADGIKARAYCNIHGLWAN